MGCLARGIAVVLLIGVVSAHAASIGGTATVDGAPASEAVLYLEGTPAAPPPDHPARAVMDQKNLTFLPRVLPVVRGTVVEFTNSDDVQHNVFTPSVVAKKFNLGTYDPGAMRSVTFTEAGDVLVLCNIHMEMEAHILVLDAPYFSTVARDGSYRISDVPAGTYTLKMWRGRWLPTTRSVDVPATGTLTVDLAAGK